MASPEGVGPELERAGWPGAPSHLLGLRLGGAGGGEELLKEPRHTTAFIRMWEIWATALQRPKRIDP